MESVDGDIVKAINKFGLINYLESSDLEMLLEMLLVLKKNYCCKNCS